MIIGYCKSRLAPNMAMESLLSHITMLNKLLKLYTKNIHSGTVNYTKHQNVGNRPISAPQQT